MVSIHSGARLRSAIPNLFSAIPPRSSPWNNTVDKVTGKIAPGERVTVHPKINPGRAFPVKVGTFEPPRRMVWTGGMPLGLFKGERTVTLAPRQNGDVEFSTREEYTGLLAPLYRPLHSGFAAR